MNFMDAIAETVSAGLAFSNALQGLVIALIAAALLGSWRNLPLYALVALLVHVATNIFIPVLFSDAVLTFPPVLTVAFWLYAAVLFAVYLAVIALLFWVKRSVKRNYVS